MSAGTLRGRNILVTGAGDGLGRAAALACASDGATVILLGRTVRKLEAVYDAIRAGGGSEPAIYPINLAGAGWNDYQELAAGIERQLDALHGIVHCAAHFRDFRRLADVEPRDWMEALQVNLTAPFALTRTCLPLLEKSGDASVVFVGDSIASRSPAYAGSYGVSKLALDALVQVWAAELSGTAVRVSRYDPGPLRTSLRARGFPGEKADRNREPDAAASDLVELLAPRR